MKGVKQRGVQVNGRRLRELRKARGLTQTELAVMAGVSDRTIRNAEACRPIRVDFLRFLAAALGVESTALAADENHLRVASQEERNVARVLEAIQIYVPNYDLSGYNELLDKNAVINLPGPDVVPFYGKFRGPDGFARLRERAHAAIRHEKMPELHDIRASGNLVLIQFMDCARVISTGVEYSGVVQYVFEFENGRVKRVDNFTDTYALAQAFDPPVKRSSRKATGKCGNARKT